MEVSQLRYFLKLAEAGNYTRAAEDLHLSQSALSRSILKLEEELGQPLFERLGRGVALTEAGEKLRHHAERIVGLLDDVKQLITDDGQTGTLRVGAIPTIAPYLLPKLFRQFTKICPAARLELIEDTTERLVKHCSRGEVDVIILALPAETPYLDCQELFPEELLLAVHSAHPFVTRKRVTTADLGNEPLIQMGEGHCLAEQVASFCLQQRIQGVSVGKTQQLSTVQELVALGHGVAFIPEMAAGVDRDKRRVYLRLAGERPSRSIAAATNPYRFQTKLQQRFLSCLREFTPQQA